MDQPFKRQPSKTVKHTQTIRRQNANECLSVFDHFVGLTLKRYSNADLKISLYIVIHAKIIP